MASKLQVCHELDLCYMFFLICLGCLYIKMFLILVYDLCDSEAIDPLTIAAAPNIGSVLRAPSVIYASFAAGRSSKSYLELQDGFLTGTQIQESTWWEKASIQKNIPEELPIGYGCTFTQTIFNGKFNIICSHHSSKLQLQLCCEHSYCGYGSRVVL